MHGERVKSFRLFYHSIFCALCF